MLQETKIEETIGFAVIFFIIGGILIGQTPSGYAYDIDHLITRQYVYRYSQGLIIASSYLPTMKFGLAKLSKTFLKNTKKSFNAKSSNKE